MFLFVLCCVVWRINFGDLLACLGQCCAHRHICASILLNLSSGNAWCLLVVVFKIIDLVNCFLVMMLPHFLPTGADSSNFVRIVGQLWHSRWISIQVQQTIYAYYPTLPHQKKKKEGPPLPYPKPWSLCSQPTPMSQGRGREKELGGKH